MWTTPSWWRRDLRYSPGHELMVGQDVAVVARKLRVPVATFGPLMEAKVRGFQRARQLPITGEVDLPTAKVIGEIHLYEPEWFSERMSPEQFRMAQTILDVEPTGIIDDATANAVRRFQSGRGLPVTGVIDSETAKWMGEL
jgi:peptidoglycan hydrolase-like protein with peptidoglycan-binding domain